MTAVTKDSTAQSFLVKFRLKKGFPQKISELNVDTQDLGYYNN